MIKIISQQHVILNVFIFINIFSYSNFGIAYLKLELNFEKCVFQDVFYTFSLRLLKYYWKNDKELTSHLIETRNNLVWKCSLS